MSENDREDYVVRKARVAALAPRMEVDDEDLFKVFSMLENANTYDDDIEFIRYLLCCIVPGILIFIKLPSDWFTNLIVTAVVGFFVYVLYKIIVGIFFPRMLSSERDKKIDVVLDQYEANCIAKGLSSNRRIDEMNRSIEEIEKIKASSTRAGDVIVNGSHNSIVVGAGSIRVIRTKQSNDPDVADALKTILGYIEETKNEEAAEYFEKFVSTIESETPDKTVLKALWQSIVSCAPPINSMLGITSTISRLFV